MSSAHPPPEAVDASSADDVVRALASEVSIEVVRPPSLAVGGFEAYTWLADLARPFEGASAIALRIYASPSRDGAQAREATVLTYLASTACPAPRLLAAGGSESAFGLPYVIMTRAPGAPIGSEMGRPWRLPSLMAAFAEAATALHAIRPDEWTIEPPPQLGVGPGEFQRIAHANPALGVAAERLAQILSRVKPADRLSIVHGDFSPANVLRDATGVVTIIDWGRATIGDRHDDIGRVIALCRNASDLGRTNGRLAAVERPLARWAERCFVDDYARRFPIQADRLQYWTAVHTLKLLGFAIAAQTEGLAERVGLKPSTNAAIPTSSAIPVLQERLLDLLDGMERDL